MSHLFLLHLGSAWNYGYNMVLISVSYSICMKLLHATFSFCLLIMHTFLIFQNCYVSITSAFLLQTNFVNSASGLRNFICITSTVYKKAAQVFTIRTWRLSQLFRTSQKSISHTTTFLSEFLPLFLTFSTPLLINVTPCTLFWRPRPVPPH